MCMENVETTLEQLHANGRQAADSRINRQTKQNGQQIESTIDALAGSILPPISGNQASKVAVDPRKTLSHPQSQSHAVDPHREALLLAMLLQMRVPP